MKIRPIAAIVFLLIAIFLGDRGLAASTGLLPICKIQGLWLTSPYHGQRVTTQGVVSADFDTASQKGFFIQDEHCDGNPATSDGIFVYLGEKLDRVQVGDWVELRGVVTEHYGMTELVAAPGDIRVLSHANPLPAALELAPPFDDDQARFYFEALESMRVRLADGRVVGPTSARGETWLVRWDLGLERVFEADPRGTGEVICLSGAGLYQLLPDARVGDRVLGSEGVLDYTLGAYQLLLTGPPVLLPAAQNLPVPPAAIPPGLTVSTLNLQNLFDTVDDPTRDDSVLSATAYHRKLEKLALLIRDGLGQPHLIGVQEAETGAVLMHLAGRPELSADYGVVWVDGPDARGLDVGLLYAREHFSLLGYQAHQGCTQLADGLGPDGNRDMQAPQNTLTCDSDGNGSLDGNRLFSRPPLVVELQRIEAAAAGPRSWVIVLHLKSRLEDTSSLSYTTARRVEQAAFTANLVAGILASDPAAPIFILGDLNDAPGSLPLQTLNQVGMADLVSRIPAADRYTYIYAGVSQVLDYVLVSPALHLVGSQVQAIHFNADYPAVFSGSAGTALRSSDHDPILVQLLAFEQRVYLPCIPH